MTKRSKSEPSPVRRIYYLFERNRAEARKLYEGTFGVAVDDPSIDEELELALRAVYSEIGDAIEVPSKLVCALVLRRRSPSGGHPRKERWAARIEKLAVRAASMRWAELLDNERVPSKRAKHRAAVEAVAQYGEGAGIKSAATIEAQMKLEAGRRDLAKSR